MIRSRESENSRGVHVFYTPFVLNYLSYRLIFLFSAISTARHDILTVATRKFSCKSSDMRINKWIQDSCRSVWSPLYSILISENESSHAPCRNNSEERKCLLAIKALVPQMPWVRGGFYFVVRTKYLLLLLKVAQKFCFIIFITVRGVRREGISDKSAYNRSLRTIF